MHSGGVRVAAQVVGINMVKRPFSPWSAILPWIIVSRQISEIKQGQAWSVLGWVTTGEAHVLIIFCKFFLLPCILPPWTSMTNPSKFCMKVLTHRSILPIFLFLHLAYTMLHKNPHNFIEKKSIVRKYLVQLTVFFTMGIFTKNSWKFWP